jgi:hypothetical protein
MVLICGDSRFMTSYFSSCELEKKFMEASGAKDSYSYKIFLQEHGKELTEKMSYEQMKKTEVKPCGCNKQVKVIRPFK